MTEPTVPARRRCTSLNSEGRPCGSPPLHEGDKCWVHDPERAEDAAEARRLGGLRRRREKAIAGAYEVTGLATPADRERVLQIALADTLQLDNSVQRNRTLVAIVVSAARLQEGSDHEQRIAILERSLQSGPLAGRSLLLERDDDLDLIRIPAVAS
jgi:hypothetical protein